ncbi:hypothetical protein P3G55_17000 [Leptospira sp. 96542]|nr:hypothetical protein [Leptospira sp. 96542]
MKFWIVVLPFLIISISTFANPIQKAEKLCECLKETKSKGSDNACLKMREMHVKALKKGSKDYETYIQELQVCEKELSGLPKIDPNLGVDEKIKIVCECFKTSEKQNRMGCFRLQSDYAKTIENVEEKKKFNLNSICD